MTWMHSAVSQADLELATLLIWGYKSVPLGLANIEGYFLIVAVLVSRLGSILTPAPQFPALLREGLFPGAQDSQREAGESDKQWEAEPGNDITVK